MSEGKNYCTVCGETLILNGLNKMVQDLIVELAGLSHNDLEDIGIKTHLELDSHVDDDTIHFIQNEIDHVNLLNKGTKLHSEIDSHITDDVIKSATDVQGVTVGGNFSGTVNNITHGSSQRCSEIIIASFGIVGGGGFTEIGNGSGGWSVSDAFSDVDATIDVSFYIRKGGTFKLVISHQGSGDNSGKSAGGQLIGFSYTDGSAETQIINDNEAHLALGNINIGKMFKSGSFTVSDGTQLNIKWIKDDNAEGASGTMMVRSIFLERQ